MDVRKTVGGKQIQTKANVEIITKEFCKIVSEIDIIYLAGFHIKNEDSKDINVSINEGEPMLLKVGEILDFKDLTLVYSCKTDVDATVRVVGLL